MSDQDFLTDRDLEINYFSMLAHSVSLTDIFEHSFSGNHEAALLGLRFAIKDKSTQQYILPPPGHGTILLNDHQPFSLGGWRGHHGKYVLHYSSAQGKTGGTVDLRTFFSQYPKPWDVKFLMVAAAPEPRKEGDFFDRPLPRRLKIFSY